MDLSISHKKHTIYPSETDSLVVPDTILIKKLIDQPSVGRYIEIEGDTLFVPVNYKVSPLKVDEKHRVPMGDLLITSELNNYKAIRFFRNDENNGMFAMSNTFLFFIPSSDSLAITKKKLAKQFPHNNYIDHNSLISDRTIFMYSYNQERKGFEIFHTEMFPSFDKRTKTEILYESIDMLRMAKHLYDSNINEYDWEKLDFVIPAYIYRYFEKPLVSEISDLANQMPNLFQYRLYPENLELEISVIKDSTLTGFYNELKHLSKNEDIDIDELSDSSGKIIDKYLDVFGFDFKIDTFEGNTCHFHNTFDAWVLHFIPNKNLLFTIKCEEPINSEIYMRFFLKELIPKLEE
ncbi:MAG: hypothetical protein ACK5MZ_01260 [Aestuariibaculum sp.]